QLRGLDCGRVVMPSESGSTLPVRYSSGLSASRLVQGGYSLAFDEGVTGYVMRTGSIGLVPDVDSEPLYIQRITERGEQRGERLSFLAVPILEAGTDRKSTRLNSSHVKISYAVFCVKKKNPEPRGVA